MTKEQATREALRMALEALEKMLFLAEHEGWEGFDKQYEAITAIKEALSSPNGEAQPEQRNASEHLEPVAWRFRSGTWFNREVHWRYIDTLEGAKGLLGLEPLYTTPPQRKPLTEQWVEVTETLLYAQHDWLYKPMWIAMPNGHVTTGYYEWRQGRNPNRFITDDLGDMHALQAAFVMPMTKPKAPICSFAHGIKE